MSSSDEQPKKRKIKTKKKGSNKSKFDKSYFIDEYAESADESESEIDSEYEAEYDEALKMQKSLPRRRPLYENMTAEEIAEKFEDRVAYQKASYMSSEVSEVSKQQILPSVNDPKLWQIFCRPGKSKEVVINLMQKSVKLKLQVFSAFASNVIPDCFYLEAFHKNDVLTAIKNVPSVNANRIFVVPINEMSDVFSMDIGPKVRLKPGEFVRVNFGTYKNDLAQVVLVEEHIGKVGVRVVPRIDFSNGNKRVRPPAKLFNPLDYPSCDRKRDLASQETYYMFQGNMFKEGLLYKTLALRSLRVDEIKPTLSEIKVFDDGKFELTLRSKKICFAPGDKVKVIKGDSKGLTGSIDSSDGSLAYIYPFLEDICDKKFEFSVNDLCKFFEVGDHVKVIEGRYIGITGMVVSFKDETVDFIADVNRSIVTVLANDLKLSEEISTGLDKAEEFRVGEIILLKNEISFGIITKLTSGGVIAVLDTGEIENVWVQDIAKRFSKARFWALDRDNNKIGFNDMVKIVFSKHPFYNKVGSVKNAFRGVVFVQILDYLDTVVVAVKSNFCLMQGTISEESEVRMDLKTAVVRLKSGPYRGYSGKVIGVSDTRLKIELSTVSKIVDVEIAACEKVEEVRELMTIQEQKRTPAVPSPAYTPGHQSPWEVQDTPTYSRMY